jgi:hypothetical protein
MLQPDDRDWHVLVLVRSEHGRKQFHRYVQESSRFLRIFMRSSVAGALGWVGRGTPCDSQKLG